MEKVRAYKLTRPDGFDFYTGKTINYAANLGGVVKPPKPNAELGICSSGVIHASINPNDCFIGAKIPCRAFVVEGMPVCGDKKKYGFTELAIVKEITDLDTLFGWKYSETTNPINPFSIKPNKVTKKDLDTLKQWDSVRASVRASVGASVRDSAWDSVRDSVRDSVWDSAWDSVRDSVGDSVWDSVWDSAWASVWASAGDSAWASAGASVWDSVGAYIGSLFPNITKWEYVPPDIKGYPYQSAVDLWKRGFVASHDGKHWRLHSGKDAKIVWVGKI